MRIRTYGVVRGVMQNIRLLDFWLTGVIRSLLQYRQIPDLNALRGLPLGAEHRSVLLNLHGLHEGAAREAPLPRKLAFPGEVGEVPDLRKSCGMSCQWDVYFKKIHAF